MARGAALRRRLGLLLALACSTAAAGPQPPSPLPPRQSDPPPKGKGPPQRSEKAEDPAAPATESGLLKNGDGANRAPAGERPAPGAPGPSPGAAPQAKRPSGVSASGPVPSSAGAFAGSAVTLANMPASAGGSIIAVVPGMATAASKKTSSSKANNSSGSSSSSSSSGSSSSGGGGAKGGDPSPPGPSPGPSPKSPSPDAYSSPRVQVVVIRQGEGDAGLPGGGSDGSGSPFANSDDLLVVSLFPSIANIAASIVNGQVSSVNTLVQSDVTPLPALFDGGLSPGSNDSLPSLESLESPLQEGGEPPAAERAELTDAYIPASERALEAVLVAPAGLPEGRAVVQGTGGGGDNSSAPAPEPAQAAAPPNAAKPAGAPTTDLVPEAQAAHNTAVGAIIGATVGAAVGIAAALCAACLLRRCRRRRVQHQGPPDVELGTAGAAGAPSARSGGSAALAAAAPVGEKGGKAGMEKGAHLADSDTHVVPWKAAVPRPADEASPRSHAWALGDGASSSAPSSSVPGSNPPTPVAAAAPMAAAAAAAEGGADRGSRGRLEGGGAGAAPGGEQQHADGGNIFQHAAPLPWTDGTLRPDEIQIMARRDGAPWELGRGAYGAVYKALKDGVQVVAVKVLPGMECQRKREDFVREVSLLRGCRDANIVHFLGACIQGDEAMLVTEFVEMGDLWRAATLKNVRGQRIFGWSNRGRKVALDVAKGLHYLHAKRVVHLDLKSANILIARDGTAKIADVGLSRVLSRSYVSAGGAGTFAWSAPEVLNGQRCTEKSDIYSFGVVLWEIVTGLAPFRGDMRELRAPEDCPAEVADLYRRCTAQDPAQRPTARQIVAALHAAGAAGPGSAAAGAGGSGVGVGGQEAGPRPQPAPEPAAAAPAPVRVLTPGPATADGGGAAAGGEAGDADPPHAPIAAAAAAAAEAAEAPSTAAEAAPGSAPPRPEEAAEAASGEPT